MRIDAYSSMTHYGDHIERVFQSLPDSHRGAFHKSPNPPPDGPGGPVIVAGYGDAQRVHDRPLILIEHGSGQTYPQCPDLADHGSYSGGDGLERVTLFIVPHDKVGRRWRDRYPSAESVAVGCPKLDPWHTEKPKTESAIPIVCLSFHWRGIRNCPESQWAWGHYEPHLAEMRGAVSDADMELVGHAHPRVFDYCAEFFVEAGIRPIKNFSDVLDEADIYCVDNSSTAMEFLSTGRGVVLMNGPQYRRDVSHGGRFWEWPETLPTIQDHEQLVPAVMRARQPWPHEVRRRQNLISETYAFTDGHCADRAADAIVAHVSQGS